MTRMHRLLIAFCLGPATLALAQHPVIDEMVQIGLRDNLALKQQTFAHAESLRRLAQAKGLFLPSVGVEARYSRAGGGRTIAFPVGDLMNPVYQTLNQYLALAGQEPRFPENLPNETIPFLRKEEQETKLRLIQPVFQPALLDNLRLQGRLAQIKALEKQAFARTLVAEIKAAYFNALKADQAKRLYKKTVEVLAEHVRVNQRLFEQDQVIRAMVWRAQAQLQAVEQKRIEAEKDASVALAYLNFLLNRDQDAAVTFVDDAALPLPGSHPTGMEAMDDAVRDREELAMLDLAIQIAGDQKALARAAFLPGLTLVADYGIQGENYQVDKDADYWMASMVLSWNLFNGFQDRNRMQEAELGKKRILAQRQEAEARIKLEARQGLEAWTAAQSGVAAAEAGQKAADEAFRAYAIQYAQGMASQLEYLDAQNQALQAGVQAIAARADLFIQQARLERILATYPLSERN